jgi:hypothetical protein
MRADWLAHEQLSREVCWPHCHRYWQRALTMVTDRCLTCGHEDVNAVNAALAAGTPARAVARQFGLGRMSVTRHQAAGHALPKPLAAIADVTDLLAEDRATRVLPVAERAFLALDRAERAGSLRTVVIRSGRALRPSW